MNTIIWLLVALNIIWVIFLAIGIWLERRHYVIIYKHVALLAWYKQRQEAAKNED